MAPQLVKSCWGHVLSAAGSACADCAGLLGEECPSFGVHGRPIFQAHSPAVRGALQLDTEQARASGGAGPCALLAHVLSPWSCLWLVPTWSHPLGLTQPDLPIGAASLQGDGAGGPTFGLTPTLVKHGSEPSNRGPHHPQNKGKNDLPSAQGQGWAPRTSAGTSPLGREHVPAPELLPQREWGSAGAVVALPSYGLGCASFPL